MSLVKIGECFPYVVMRAFHKTNHHPRKFMVSRGKSPRLKGVQISFVLCPRVFFYDEHTTCKSPCSNLALFRVHLPYLGDYVHFLGINAHNSSSNNWCMKGSTRTAWKTMLVPFSKLSCLLQGMGIDSKGMRGNSQPQTRHLLGYQL